LFLFLRKNYEKTKKISCIAISVIAIMLEISCGEKDPGNYTFLSVGSARIDSVEHIHISSDTLALIDSLHLIDSTNETGRSDDGGGWYLVTCTGTGKQCPANHVDSYIWLNDDGDGGYTPKREVNLQNNLLSTSSYEYSFNELRTALYNKNLLYFLKTRATPLFASQKFLNAIIIGVANGKYNAFESHNGDILFYEGSLDYPKFVKILHRPNN
jgi:hypothetical protein